MSSIVGVQFRNLATVGGSVYARFGFSDVTTALLALDARWCSTGGGDAPGRLHGLPIRFDDILVKVRVRDDGRTAAYESLRRTTTDCPVLAVAVSRLGDDWPSPWAPARPCPAVRGGRRLSGRRGRRRRRPGEAAARAAALRHQPAGRRRLPPGDGRGAGAPGRPGLREGGAQA